MSIDDDHPDSLVDGPLTDDDDIDWLVLFATDLHDPHGDVEARAAEWRELLG